MVRSADTFRTVAVMAGRPDAVNSTRSFSCSDVPVIVMVARVPEFPEAGVTPVTVNLLPPHSGHWQVASAR